MRFSQTFAASALAAVASADGTNYLGFNTGSTKLDGSAKVAADWVAEFKTAQGLQGAPGTFNAARLYTNIQGGSTNDPIEAFEAAINTTTYLLLGVWCSGTTSIANELSALQKGLDKYGDALAKLVIGISIGSEDLYRNSVTGITNKAGVGNQPDAIVGFINDYRAAVKGTALEKVPVGHVDTWDVYPNATNKAVIDACDWIGLDEYPFYETGKGNDIKNSYNRFTLAYNAAKAAIGDKPMWVTETGWPTNGTTWDQAVPSVANAKFYWDNIGCQLLFNKVPTFWYTLQDANAADNDQFAISPSLSTTPAYNLTCPTTFDIGPASSSNSTTGSSTNSTTPVGGSNSTSTVGVPSSTSTSGSGTSPSGTTSGGPTTTSSSSATSSPPKSAGNSLQSLPAVIYATIALAAGVAAFL